MTLVEGVEHNDDILTCYEIGVDLLQGYYFSHPEPPEKHLPDVCGKNIRHAADAIAEHLEQSLVSRLQIQGQFDTIIRKMSNMLAHSEVGLFDECLGRVIQNYLAVECA